MDEDQRIARIQHLRRITENRKEPVHPDESRQAREELRLALIEADKAMAMAKNDAEKNDIGRRTVALASRFKLAGGHIEDIPGHEGKRWAAPWKQ
jgi:hypothetical protein